jgi:hypothetical protein
MNEAEEYLVVGGVTIWPQTGARSNEARDDSEDNDSSSDLGAKQENLIKRWTTSLRVTVVQVQRLFKDKVFSAVVTSSTIGQLTFICRSIYRIFLLLFKPRVRCERVMTMSYVFFLSVYLISKSTQRISLQFCTGGLY